MEAGDATVEAVTGAHVVATGGGWTTGKGTDAGTAGVLVESGTFTGLTAESDAPGEAPSIMPRLAKLTSAAWRKAAWLSAMARWKAVWASAVCRCASW